MLEEVGVGLPDDGQHYRVDATRVVPVVLLVLDLRGVEGERKALLEELQVGAEAPHEALLAVVAPRQAGAVHAPHAARLLRGLETGAAHAVAHDEAQRVLRPRACAAQQGRGQ